MTLTFDLRIPRSTFFDRAHYILKAAVLGIGVLQTHLVDCPVFRSYTVVIYYKPNVNMVNVSSNFFRSHVCCVECYGTCSEPAPGRSCVRTYGGRQAQILELSLSYTTIRATEFYATESVIRGLIILHCLPVCLFVCPSDVCGKNISQ